MDITLGGKPLPLQLPPSFATRHEIAASFARNPQRAVAAALGVACPGLKLKARYTFAPLEYGGAVIDELVARGLDVAEVLSAGGTAFKLVAENILSGEALKAAEGK